MCQFLGGIMALAIKDSQYTVGNLYSFSDNGYFNPQKLVQYTHTSQKCSKNFFWKILTSGLDGLVTFGLVALATLLKSRVLSKRAERFLHTKFHQNPFRNDKATASFRYLLRHFI